MNKKNIFYVNITFFLVFFNSAACLAKNANEFARYVAQPEVQIGDTVDLHILFECKPQNIQASTNKIKGIEPNADLEKILENISKTKITDENSKTGSQRTFFSYSFSTTVKPTNIGQIDFPTLTVNCNGKKYTTQPFHINVVDKLNIENDDVKIAWAADKINYSIKDTITLTLYQYSKFSQSNQRRSPAKNTSLTAQENQIKFNIEESIDSTAGIDGFENNIEEKFDIVDMEFDMFSDISSMEKINNEFFIKKLILKLSLLPKTKGMWSVGPSEFEYSVYKGNADYFKSFVSNGDGSYTITNNGSTSLKIKSNLLTIKVE